MVILSYLDNHREAYILSKKYRIVADENMPQVDPLFGNTCEIRYMPGREITAADLVDADALLCRSITQIDKTLLQNTAVQFVGTATIGTDHLDLEWLEANDIAWSSAAGCNAAAVAQYVLSATAFWLQSRRVREHQKQSLNTFADIRVGIVGAGNVGSELARCLDVLGIDYLLCDPPLQRKGDPRQFVDMSEIMLCDLITLHVPLTRTGEDKTWHMLDSTRLQQLSSKQLLVNASRGAVVDNTALLDYLRQTAPVDAASIILDVFEGEPEVNQELLQRCLLATPHIAGHTLEGKVRGTFLIYQAFYRHFGLPEQYHQAALFPPPQPVSISSLDATASLLELYDISRDSQQFLTRQGLPMAEHFDRLRKNYLAGYGDLPRRDYSGWKLAGEVPLKFKRLCDSSG